jgi:hypothetical protein
MKKPNIWIFSIEPLETRYTGQWHQHFPQLLNAKLGDSLNIVQIDGVQKNTAPTPGAFLNFSDTNYWKSSQLCNFLDHYNRGKTTLNDHFIFTDAWNPTVLQLKYMNDLLGFSWKLHGLYHAGSWDYEDFLGRLIGNASWVRHTEKAFFHAFDYNYFATQFHLDMYRRNLMERSEEGKQIDSSLTTVGKVLLTGWPMEYMKATLEPYRNGKKENLIVFPHRIAPEKQVDIFYDLEKQLPQYEFVVCQEEQLSKHQYHQILSRAKIVFSANLQETLGISTCLEGPLVGALPLAPDRLSYSEIFQDGPEFLYPSEWTESWNHYVANRNQLVGKIQDLMENYHPYSKKINLVADTVYKKYFNSTNLIENIKSNE